MACRFDTERQKYGTARIDRERLSRSILRQKVASDTASLLDLLVRHRERLSPLQPDTTETRLLQFLVERRREVVDEKTAQSNRLTDCLKLYFPQILRWFDDVASPLVGTLLERWPSLQDLRRAHPGTLSKFFHEQNCRGEERIHERIAAIYQAVPATQDEAALEAGAMTARGLVAVLATLRDDIAKLDQRIAQLVADHPEAPLFDSLPGAGKALVPRLIVAFGTRRERYESAYQMQCYSGIAPVRVASGKTQTIHFRRACPKFLRQTFHEYALALAPEIGVGQGVLPDPARSPQVTPCGGQSLGLQMDSHHFPVLEGRQTL